MKIENLNSIQKNVGSTADKVQDKPVVSKVDAISNDAVEFQMNGDSQDQSVINDEMLERAIEMANKTLKKHDNFIERSVHEKTKAVMYVLRDQETNEVIKEFPPKKIEDMIAKMWELAGLFVDEKA